MFTKALEFAKSKANPLTKTAPWTCCPSHKADKPAQDFSTTGNVWRSKGLWATIMWRKMERD